MEYKEITGDLFACPETHSLAHCVSEDLKMGKGIATIFKREFGGLKDLEAQKVSVGGVAVLQRNKRYIYYLVTKMEFHQIPKYPNLKLSLEAMQKHCVENGVKDLAMPKIACGLDRLKWPQVSEMIKEVFADTKINITIYTRD